MVLILSDLINRLMSAVPLPQKSLRSMKEVKILPKMEREGENKRGREISILFRKHMKHTVAYTLIFGR